MIIKEIGLSEKGLKDNDYKDMLQIYINDKRQFNFHEGEPEDATLGRDFNDVYNIVFAMRKAHEAGVAGESFEFEEILLDEL